jgi:hypothetical protein
MDMEPLEINRSALIAIAKQPFIDWLHTVDPSSGDINLSAVNHEPSVYLVPVFDSDEDFMDWLEEHCHSIFEEQLGGWWTDQRSGHRIAALKSFRNGSNVSDTRWSGISITSRFSLKIP